MIFTVLGGSGFIGRNLSAYLQKQGHTVHSPPRGALLDGIAVPGHVLYAIGLTGNYRQQPDDTVDAHVNVLRRVLKNKEMMSLTYLSSTRVYNGMDPVLTADEETRLMQKSGPDGVYDFSKLLGESLCLNIANDAVRAVRLSNVYGIGQSVNTFLGSVLKDLRETGKTVIQDHPDSSKDYVSINDVVALLPRIATEGSQRLYNLASGTAVTCRDIAQILQEKGYKIDFSMASPARSFPRIDITRIATEFGFLPRALVDDLPSLTLQGEMT